MQLLTCFILIQTLWAIELYAWRIFTRGRRVGGNLGLPGFKARDIQYQLFTQPLDHFNYSMETTTWKQRYYVNSQYYDSETGGPVFLMIGGAGEVGAEWMTNGAWIDYANESKALCFLLEHRYYGHSYPTSTLSTLDLEYLSSQQALADLATFIEAMGNKYGLPPQQKWFAFGGSYAGSLAAWLRLKYPHLVGGAMSSSGPLLAIVDFRDYYKLVVESLNNYDEKCVDAVQKGISEIDVELRDPEGLQNINTQFKLCDPIVDIGGTPNDVSNLFEIISGNFAGVVQHNKDNRIGGNIKAANITIDVLCDIMMNMQLGPVFDRLAAVNSLLLDAYNHTCLDYKYDKMISAFKNDNWDSSVAEGGRRVGGILGLPGFKARNEIYKIFIQALDHFNSNETKTWKQRYYVNSQYYDSKTGGPVFLMIEGAGEASAEWMTKGAWIDYANESKALCFILEHRYYGRSFPTRYLNFFPRQWSVLDSTGTTPLLQSQGQGCHLLPLFVLGNYTFMGNPQFNTRQWMYQTCSELGYSQTSSYTPQVFSNHFPVEFFNKQCLDIFGDEFTSWRIYESADNTNKLYGGLETEVKNVVFVHGSIDPWRILGITSTVNPESPAILIEGAAHCANMYSKSENDSPELQEARAHIGELISRWSQAEQDRSSAGNIHGVIKPFCPNLFHSLLVLFSLTPHFFYIILPQSWGA